MGKRSTFRKISVAVTIAAAFFINSAAILAQSQDFSGTQETEVETQQSMESQQIDPRAIKRMRFLDSIREEMRATQRDFLDITRSMGETGSRLEEVQKVAKTLSEQLNIINTQIRQTEALIANVIVQIGQTENELVLLYEDMEIKKAQIENQKKMLSEYLETLYEQESGIGDTLNGNSEVNIAKLLLSNQTAGEQLQEIRYFSVLEKTGLEIFDRLEELLNDLEIDEKILQEKKDKLTALNVRLTEEKRNLEAQKDAKANLLEETKGEEKIYQQLLDESRMQQQQVQDDLTTLRDNLKFIETKIEELGDDFNPDDYTSLFSKEKSSIYEYISTNRESTGFDLRWPVSPSRGITAYFHDASYKAFFGFAHNAIDVRIPQGSIIRAPEDGIVYKVRDNGYGYSYLILAHEGGFMTVYGHVSEFRVEEGEKVFTGQAIGLTGGNPGSKGAGLMTTGAHLHFELMKGGKYVDPLEYLPLSFVPVDYIPEKYKSLITGDKPKVRRVNGEDSAYSSDVSLTQMIERNALIEGTVVQLQQ